MVVMLRDQWSTTMACVIMSNPPPPPVASTPCSIPAGEGAVLNINQREELADYHRQAMAASMVPYRGGNAHGHGMGGWDANAAAAVAAGAANRLPGGMGGGGAYSGYGARPR